ncbi:MAG: cysteine hydrolase family protein [Candidatus Binataceae bacterium]
MSSTRPSADAVTSHADTTALLVLDLQVDFLEPNGRMPIARDQIGQVLANSNRAIEAATARHIAIVYIGNEYTRWDIPGNWFRRNAARVGTPGATLDPRLKRVVAAPYFSKRQGDAFSNPELERFLRLHHIHHLVICGVYADACVTATARGALLQGFAVTVLSDAVGAASDASRQSALAKLSRGGAQVEPTADFANLSNATSPKPTNAS